MLAMKDLIFVIDIGNTHIASALYRAGKLERLWRVGSDPRRTEDEYFVTFQRLIKQCGCRHEDVRVCAVASVVPELTRVFRHMIDKYFACELIDVTAMTPLGLKFPMEDPSFIGADLIVNAFSAKEKYRSSCIVCDFGTATTIQLVGADGFFYGTAIAPGVITATAGLVKNTALLFGFQLEKPNNLLGTTTRDALKSGFVNGFGFLTDGFITGIRNEYAWLEPITVIATGGISALICSSIKQIDHVDRTLTLDGLNLICEKHPL